MLSTQRTSNIINHTEVYFQYSWSTRCESPYEHKWESMLIYRTITFQNILFPFSEKVAMGLLRCRNSVLFKGQTILLQILHGVQATHISKITNSNITNSLEFSKHIPCTLLKPSKDTLIKSLCTSSFWERPAERMNIELNINTLEHALKKQNVASRRLYQLGEKKGTKKTPKHQKDT